MVVCKKVYPFRIPGNWECYFIWEKGSLQMPRQGFWEEETFLDYLIVLKSSGGCTLKAHRGETHRQKRKEKSADESRDWSDHQPRMPRIAGSSLKLGEKYMADPPPLPPEFMPTPWFLNVWSPKLWKILHHFCSFKIPSFGNLLHVGRDHWEDVTLDWPIGRTRAIGLTLPPAPRPPYPCKVSSGRHVCASRHFRDTALM